MSPETEMIEMASLFFSFIAQVPANKCDFSMSYKHHIWLLSHGHMKSKERNT